MSGAPQFPTPDWYGAQPLRPGGAAHKAGPTMEQRLEALERGEMGRPGPGVVDGCVVTSSAAAQGGAKWQGPLVDWTTFPYAAGVTDYGSGFGPPKYMKDALGTVFVRGLIQPSATSAASSLLGTLPAGCRPGVSFRVMLSRSAVATDTNISAAGAITMAHVAADWISVSFSFKAEA